MSEDAYFFFAGRWDRLALYEAFVARVHAEVSDVVVKVQKTQITFVHRHVFACVSLPRRKIEDAGDGYIVVTFGLPYRLDAKRVMQAVEPYPNRWTHHVVVSAIEQIDEELMGWIREAYHFAAAK